MSMKTTLIAILFCCLQTGAFAQSAEVKSYITEITTLIKQHSLVAAQINWQEYEKGVSELSRNINSVDSCRAVQNYIISTLRKSGDKHSFFINRQGVQGLIDPSVNNLKYTEGRLLNANTAYIKIPSM